MPNLAGNLVTSADRYPDRPCLRLDSLVVNYAELNRRSSRVAGLLAAAGIASGDRVGLMLPNVPAFPAAYYGILRAGAVVVPMNPLLKSREVAYYLGDSGARLLFTSPGSVAEAEPGAQPVGTRVIVVDDGWDTRLDEQPDAGNPVPREADDTAVILYTSGTTGRPKGAELTHANLIANTDVVSRSLLGLTPDDVVMGGLPLFHSYGQVLGLNAAVHSGACLTLIQPRGSAPQAGFHRYSDRGGADAVGRRLRR